MTPQMQTNRETKRSVAGSEATTENESIVEILKKTLADEYLLQLKTQNCHWNIEGPLFFSLHKLFEEQYRELFELVDRCAEVTRALKAKAPGSFVEFKEISAVQEITAKLSSNQMIETLSQDHTNLALALKARLEIADEADEASATVLFEDLIAFHEKASWMIRSHRA